MSNGPTPTPEHFDSETLSSLRESARIYQKLDLAYLAAAGTIITALKVSNDTIIEISAGLTYGVFAFLIILAIDTYTEQTIYNDWIESRKNSNIRQSTKTIQRLLAMQPKCHLIFLSCLMTYYIGMANGITDSKKQMSNRATIQNSASIFFYNNSRPPKNIEELKSAHPEIKAIHEALGLEPIVILPNKDTKYKMVFSGSDKKFDTSDDIRTDGNLTIQDIIDAIKKNE